MARDGSRHVLVHLMPNSSRKPAGTSAIPGMPSRSTTARQQRQWRPQDQSATVAVLWRRRGSGRPSKASVPSSPSGRSNRPGSGDSGMPRRVPTDRASCQNCSARRRSAARPSAGTPRRSSRSASPGPTAAAPDPAPDSPRRARRHGPSSAGERRPPPARPSPKTRSIVVISVPRRRPNGSCSKVECSATPAATDGCAI